MTHSVQTTNSLTKQFSKFQRKNVDFEGKFMLIFSYIKHESLVQFSVTYFLSHKNEMFFIQVQNSKLIISVKCTSKCRQHWIGQA